MSCTRQTLHRTTHSAVQALPYLIWPGLLSASLLFTALLHA